MKALIVCVSVSHGNTRRVADAIAEVIGADVVPPEEVAPAEVGRHDLVGFGSGIYGMTFHPRLWRLVRSLPKAPGTPAFIFATSGSPRMWRPASLVLNRILRYKGYRMLGTFGCTGFDTWLPLRLVGGINKGRPNEDDLQAARDFAARLLPESEAAASPRAAPRRPAARAR